MTFSVCTVLKTKGPRVAFLKPNSRPWLYSYNFSFQFQTTTIITTDDMLACSLPKIVQDEDMLFPVSWGLSSVFC